MVKARGGIAIAQDPKDAAFADMPRNAIENAKPAHILPAAEIAEKLIELVPKRAATNGKRRTAKYLEAETKIAEFDMEEMERGNHPGKPSGYSCPDCNGVLWEIDEDEMVRFRCRVGHAYTAANRRKPICAAGGIG